MPITTAAWIIGGSTLASAGIGASSSKSAASQQERAMQQEAAARQQDLDFRRKIFEEEKAFQGPMREELRNQALSTQPLGYERTSGEIKKQYSNVLRNLSGYGGMGGGNVGAAARQAQFGQAQDLTKAYDEGVMKRMALLQAMGTGGNVANYANMYAQGFGGQADMYGRNASMYGNLAAAGAEAMGKAISSGIGAYGTIYGGVAGNPNYKPS